MGGRRCGRYDLPNQELSPWGDVQVYWDTEAKKRKTDKGVDRSSAKDIGGFKPGAVDSLCKSLPSEGEKLC